MHVKLKKLNEDAVVPSYQSFGASGFDFHSTESLAILPGDTKLIPTGLAFEIPVFYELQVRPRSGLSLKTNLRVTNSPGTVDADFRGEVKIIMQNTGTHTEYISKGDRIAQGVICPIIQAVFQVVEELGDTERGAGGFGSTGK